MGDQPKTCYEAGARADATDSHRLPGCGQARGPHQLLLIGLQAVMGGGSTTRLVLEILGSPYGRFFDRQVQHGSDMTRWSPSSSWVSSGTAPQRRCPITRFDTRWRSAPVSGRFRAAPESRCRNAAWAVEAANLKHDARQSTSRAPAHGSDKPARKRGAPSAPRGNGDTHASGSCGRSRYHAGSTLGVRVVRGRFRAANANAIVRADHLPHCTTI